VKCVLTSTTVPLLLFSVVTAVIRGPGHPFPRFVRAQADRTNPGDSPTVGTCIGRGGIGISGAWQTQQYVVPVVVAPFDVVDDGVVDRAGVICSPSILNIGGVLVQRVSLTPFRIAILRFE